MSTRPPARTSRILPFRESSPLKPAQTSVSLPWWMQKKLGQLARERDLPSRSAVMVRLLARAIAEVEHQNLEPNPSTELAGKVGVADLSRKTARLEDSRLTDVRPSPQTSESLSDSVSGGSSAGECIVNEDIAEEVMPVEAKRKPRGKGVKREPVPMSQLPTDLWTVEHVAAFLGKSRDWVYAKTAEGLLPVKKVGGANRYMPAEIAAWVRDL